MAEAREFTVVAPNLALAWSLPLLCEALAVVATWSAVRANPHAIGALTWSGIGPLTISTIGTALIAVIIHRRRVVLADGVLKIAAGINTAKIAVDQLDPAAARIVDLDVDKNLAPRTKTMGANLPGLKAGHFRLRDRRRAFVLVTDRQRVLTLPQRNGRMLLLSLERPQQLLDALARLAAANARR